EAIICGYTDSETGGSLFGSLILGMYQNENLTYVGNCGTGFSNEEQKQLLKKLKQLETDLNPFQKKIALKGRTPHWVKPQLICEVKFSEWTKSGVMRHPSYKGLRDDQDLEEIQAKAPKAAAPKSKDGVSSLEVEGISVPVTNLEKIYWPDAGYTKYDLID